VIFEVEHERVVEPRAFARSPGSQGLEAQPMAQLVQDDADEVDLAAGGFASGRIAKLSGGGPDRLLLRGDIIAARARSVTSMQGIGQGDGYRVLVQGPAEVAKRRGSAMSREPLK
jgi:hypothetical protein